MRLHHTAEGVALQEAKTAADYEEGEGGYGGESDYGDRLFFTIGGGLFFIDVKLFLYIYICACLRFWLFFFTDFVISSEFSVITEVS